KTFKLNFLKAKGDPKSINRRSFIGTTSAVAAGWTLLPGSVINGLTKTSGNKLNTVVDVEKWWEKEPLRIVELEEGYEFEEKAALLNDLGANMEHLTTFTDTSPGTSFLSNHDLFTGKNVDFDSLKNYLSEAHKKNIKVVIY